MQVLMQHLPQPAPSLEPSGCVGYEPPEAKSGTGALMTRSISSGAVQLAAFDKVAMRALLDGHDLEARDWVYKLMASSDLFVSRRVGDKVFASPDFDRPMDEMRDRTLERMVFLLHKELFQESLTDSSYENSLKQLAVREAIGIFDHAWAVKLGVHFTLW